MARIPEDIESLTIVHYPDPVLHQPAEPVTDFADPRLALLVNKMRSLMHEAKGVGIAANQVGVPVRVFIAEPTRDTPSEIVAINPEFIETEGWQETREGCLSVPEASVKLRRRERVKLRYQDLAGQSHEVEGAGYLASIFQHESDHLDGRLIVDRAGLIGRMAVRDVLHKLEDEYAATHAAAK